MKNILVSTIVLFALTGFAETIPVKKAIQKRTTSSAGYMQDDVKDLRTVLSYLSSNADYNAYSVENIRNGAAGDAKAFFVHLIKPFTDGPGKPAEGICLTLQVDVNNKVIVGNSESCTAAN